MLIGSLRVAALALLGVSLWFLPQPTSAEDGVAGVYVVQGTSPGGGAYEGIAEIKATGKIYEIIWQIGQDTYRGRGLAHGKGLAFAFVGAGFTNANIVLYERAGAGIWCGVWTSDKASQVGTEALILRSEAATPKKFDCSEITASRDGIDLLDRQVAWDQGDGDPQLADELRR
jgi:hypothetical protein